MVWNKEFEGKLQAAGFTRQELDPGSPAYWTFRPDSMEITFEPTIDPLWYELAVYDERKNLLLQEKVSVYVVDPPGGENRIDRSLEDMAEHRRMLEDPILSPIAWAGWC